FTGAISLALGNAGGATLSGNGPVNAVNGVATFANLTIDKVGTGYTLKTTSGKLGRATCRESKITAGAAAPAKHLEDGVQPSNTQVGATITPAVTGTALGAPGNAVPSCTGAVSIAIDNNPVGGTLTGNAPVNAVNGVATFPNLKIDKVGTGYTLKTTSGTLTPATSNAFNITAAPPPPAPQPACRLQPSNTQVGVAITPAVTVTALDASGNMVPSFTGAISLA